MKALVIFDTRPEAIKMASALDARLEERRAPHQPEIRVAVPDGPPTTLYRNQVNSAI